MRERKGRANVRKRVKEGRRENGGRRENEG